MKIIKDIETAEMDFLNGQRVLVVSVEGQHANASSIRIKRPYGCFTNWQTPLMKQVSPMQVITDSSPFPITITEFVIPFPSWMMKDAEDGYSISGLAGTNAGMVEMNISNTVKARKRRSRFFGLF